MWVNDIVQMELPHPHQIHHCNTAQKQGIVREEVAFCLKLFPPPPTLAFLVGLLGDLKM